MNERTSAMRMRVRHGSARVVAAALLALAPLSAIQRAEAQQSGERSGQQVVEATCASCHAAGANGAPKIGDKKAWSKRTSLGLSGLTKEAIAGIRKMPGHGGDLTLTDLEIGRAVTYMVNKSGGKWVEPASPKAMAAERSGRQIVEAQCTKCHKTGEGGAPKIGDREAWAPRLSQGVDNTVRSATRGHGGMPARGGMANLSDAELRKAILYMLNPGGTAAK